MRTERKLLFPHTFTRVGDLLSVCACVCEFAWRCVGVCVPFFVFLLKLCIRKQNGI